MESGALPISSGSFPLAELEDGTQRKHEKDISDIGPLLIKWLGPSLAPYWCSRLLAS